MKGNRRVTTQHRGSDAGTVYFVNFMQIRLRKHLIIGDLKNVGLTSLDRSVQLVKRH
jgi:hypothetical protein